MQIWRLKENMGLDDTCNNHTRDNHPENHCACVFIAITPPNLMSHTKADRAHVVAALQETYTRRSRGEQMEREDPPRGIATPTCWQSTSWRLGSLIRSCLQAHICVCLKVPPENRAQKIFPCPLRGGFTKASAVCKLASSPKPFMEKCFSISLFI